MANTINVGNNSWVSESVKDKWTPNIYAIIKDVWVLQYRDQLRLDEYFIMQSTKKKICKELLLNPEPMHVMVAGINYSIIFKGNKWQIDEIDNSRWLLSFRANKANNFAVVLAKSVNEAYGCPDYKHFPIGDAS